jgi:hypothetical protein
LLVPGWNWARCKKAVPVKWGPQTMKNLSRACLLFDGTRICTDETRIYTDVGHFQNNIKSF